MEQHNVCLHDDHHNNIHRYYREWVDGKPGPKQQEIIENYHWYFIIKTEDSESVRDCSVSHYIDKIEVEENTEWSRVYCQNRNYSKSKRMRGEVDSKMELLRELKDIGIQTYEADLASYQRYMLDNNVEMGQKFVTLYFDIETDDRGNGIEIGRDQIISFAAYDPLTKKTYYKSTDNEAGLIKAMLKLFSQYDVIIGWNSEGFDLPYIRARAHSYELWDELYLLMGVQSLDLMVKFQETYGRDTAMVEKFRSFKLNDVANYFLDYGKIERGSTWDMFMNEPAKLKEYNIRDVQLLDQLEEKTGVVDLSIIKAYICGARLNEKTSGRVLDQYIIRAANKRGVHYRSVLGNVIDEEPSFTNSYAGGHVFEPIIGRHTNLHTFDFSSLYPSIIRTFNISPETFRGKWDSGLVENEGDGPFIRVQESEPLNNDIGTPTNVRYAYLDGRGVIPELIHDLVCIRNKIRKEVMPTLDPKSFEYKNLDKKQYVYKVLANSMYGIIGAPFFRYYHHDMAESITRSGHFLVKEASNFCKKQGHQTVYGDTDSIFVKIEDGTDPQHLADLIKEHLAAIVAKEFNVRESFLVMDYEKSWDKFLIVGKKKYVGVLTDGTFKMTGFEAKKRDTVKCGADAQMHLFDMIIKNDMPVETVKAWLTELKKKVLAGEVPLADLTLYKKLTKQPKEFVAYQKGGKLPAHVQVYLDAKDVLKGGLTVGSYIPMIVTQGKPLSGVHPDLLEDKQAYDKTYYWNTRIYAILKRVLVVAFPEETWDEFDELTEAQLKKKLRKESGTDKVKGKRRIKVTKPEEVQQTRLPLF